MAFDKVQLARNVGDEPCSFGIAVSMETRKPTTGITHKNTPNNLRRPGGRERNAATRSSQLAEFA